MPVQVVFTSYNASEAQSDAAAWRAVGGRVTHGPCANPYRAQEPIQEPADADKFYYHNGWTFFG